MGKRLYEVSVTVVGYVLADDEADALGWWENVLDAGKWTPVLSAREVREGEDVHATCGPDDDVFDDPGASIRLRDVWPGGLP